MSGESWLVLPIGDRALVVAHEAGAVAMLEGDAERVAGFLVDMPADVALASITLLLPADADARDAADLLDALTTAARAGRFVVAVATVAGSVAAIAAGLRARFSRTPRTFH